MTEYPLTWLASVLRAEGCRVVEESGWTTRGRPASSGSFRPRAVLHHWDASSPGSHGAISTVINGNSSTPGPLCSILTCRGNSSHGPSVHVIAAGRTNHGGTGDGWGTIPRDDANTYAVGHEIAHTVDEPWSADQQEQVHMAEAAILRKLAADAGDSLAAHSEYAPGRKIDTTEGDYGQDMRQERATVQDYIDGEPEPPEEEPMRHEYVQLSTAADLDVPAGSVTIKFETEEADSAGLHGAGNAGIVPDFRCTATGVVQVHGSGRYAVEVTRVPDGSSSTQSRSYDESYGGWTNSPFTTALNAGDALRVRLKALDPDVPSRVSHVRLYLDLMER